MNASPLLHLLLCPVCTSSFLVTAFVPVLEVNCRFVCLCFRLLVQGLVLNSEPGLAGNLGAVAELREDEDEAYFSSYGHYGIHEEMLKV